ncbi:MAG TPA: flagellar export protein FliJ [Deltaproteobacteria bacterium]|nr:flagellar export protein FliJ [Deltaproteobacteria bacterium]
MGFHFRFETLLKVRKIKENKAQQEFSKAQRHRQNLENLKNMKDAEKHEMIRELTSRMRSGMSAFQMSQYHDYIGFLEEGIKQIAKNIIAAEKQLDLKRGEMLQAKKEHTAIERLKEIDRERYTLNQRKSEMRFIDEIAIMRYGESQ